MGIDALALLHVPTLSLHDSGPAAADVVELEDAVLIRMKTSFAAEPEELAAALRSLLGERLSAHTDARGVFFVPDVALEHAKRAARYGEVIEAIGELGTWVRLEVAAAPAQPRLLEGLMARALEGEEVDPEVMQAAMRDGLAQMASAFSRGDAAGGEDLEDEEDADEDGAQPAFDLTALLADPAMLALAEKMRDLMPPQAGNDDDDLERDGDEEGEDDDGDEPEGDGTDTELDGAMPDLGALMRSPAFAEMMRTAQEILTKNPDEARKLAERFGLGAAPQGASDDEE